MGQYVVVLNTLDGSGNPFVYRFAMGPGIAFTDDGPANSVSTRYVDGGLLSWQGATQKVVVGTDGVVASQVTTGEIQIVNQPQDMATAGPVDELMGRITHHGIAQLYWCPDKVWANAVLLSQGQMLQPLANLSTSTSITSIIRLPLRDPRSQLDTALQTVKYAGTNDATVPLGVEGGPDLKGKPKPILLGVATNFAGVLCNTPLLIYQLHSAAGANVACVRDGGVPLTPGVSRASLASLQATSPTPGTYDSYTGAEGLFVRLGSTPVFRLTFDAYEGATIPDRTHAQVWARLRVNYCLTPSGNIDTTSTAAADALDGNEVGWWWGDETTCMDAVNTVLASFSGYEFKDIVTKKWSIKKLLAPSGTPLLNLLPVTAAAELKATDRKLMKLDRVQPSYLPDGVPPWRVNVEWGLNYTVMVASDFAAAAADRLKAKFKEQWRTESDSDSAVSTLYFASNEMTIPTGYQNGPDGLTCPQAAAEAVRIRALYTADRPAYQAAFEPKLADTVEIGQVYSLTYPMYGLAAGKLFLVMQAADLVVDNKRTSTVILGLQT